MRYTRVNLPGIASDCRFQWPYLASILLEVRLVERVVEVSFLSSIRVVARSSRSKPHLVALFDSLELTHELRRHL